jgi:bifunctional non-homologous end joining protein LigD
MYVHKYSTRPDGEQTCVSLTEYRRKRKFGETREPEPGKVLAKGKRAIFVVQLHHASRRHYDFRLQVGDALKSWAVPKGPSYDPSVKRMAVEVEDHPLDYATFEGEIPRGHYGGGHVAQFDHGVWSTEGDPEAQLAKGHLRFELFGKKLKGGWHLVRSGKPAKQPQWLLFKDKDAYAGNIEADDLLADVTKAPAADLKRSGAGKADKKKLAAVTVAGSRRKRNWSNKAIKLTSARKGKITGEFFEPQLAKLGQMPPEGEQWLHEIKWDGYRLVGTVLDGKARLFSRNALEWTAKVPEIIAAIEALKLTSAAFDGELIAGQGTKEDFNLLQATLSGEKMGALSFVLFDLLHLDGVDLSNAPLIERKELLEEVLGDPPPHLAFSSHIPADGNEAYRLASERNFEGIISKRADRPHHAGRSEEWRKTKHLGSDEFAVVGFTAPKGGRKGFGSLLLARPDARHGWLYAGRVGSGFSDELLRKVAKTMEAGQKEPTAHVAANDTDLRAARWFEPAFVVEVFYRGIGGNGLLRQPSLKGLRPDKAPKDLRDSDRAPAKRTTKAAKKARGSTRSPLKPEGEFRLTSPDKVVFPDDRITKQQVADYYQSMLPWILPEIANRPVSIIRCPQGVGRPCFFQKHHTAGLEAVDMVKLKEEAGNQAEYLVVRNERALMELVQFNALEFHPWGSTADKPEHANRVVFDLDPGDDVPWSDVVDAARKIRGLLEGMKIASYLRTSGGKGLHVVLPLNPGCEWDLVKPFAHAFADTMSAMEPLKFISTATKRFRKGKIFLDYLRNGRGATAVASFSLRARPGAPVAMPLHWEELAKIKSGHAFDIVSAPARMKRLKKHPWDGIEKVKQDLEQVSRLLAGKPRSQSAR